MISFAYAQAAGAQGGILGTLGGLAPLIAIFGVFYFLMIRPQQKKAKELRELISSLKKGDEVLSAGGIVGRVSALDESYIDLEVSEGLVMKVQRNSIINILPKGSMKKIG